MPEPWAVSERGECRDKRRVLALKVLTEQMRLRDTAPFPNDSAGKIFLAIFYSERFCR